MRIPSPLPAILLAATALSGCSMAPKYVQPALPVPASWPVGDAYLRQSEAALPSVRYSDIFRDARLQRLIAQALANNRDLRVAAANIAATRAQYRIQRASLLPQVDATGRYSYTDRGSGGAASQAVGNGGTGTGTGGTGTGTGGVGTGGTGTGVGTGGTGGSIVTGSGGNGSAWSVNLGTTAFELDLFGRVRSLTGAALDRYFATEAGARATRLTLVGDIADAWLNYGADQSLLAIAQQTAASAERSVTLTRARLEGGIAPRTDLRQAEQVLATAQADLAQQKTAVAQDVNALQLLVGAPIETSLLPASIEEAAPTIATLPAGLDSGILLRRPDVVQAEYQLRATNGQIGAARAALFPRISLTGLVGFASTALSSLFSGGSFNYSVAPSVSYPIFQAGAGVAGVRYSEAQRDAALATYEKTIQTAFQETADALARQGTIADQLGANRRFLTAAADTYRLTEASYRGGITPFLNTLDAQRSLYSAQRTVIATQLTAASNRVTLYRVLGGDSLLEATANGPVPVSPAS
ncbi:MULTISPECIES: efflux transporter outer membrane subunit [unclassified Sphingomonas]|uniref:efflux transporter outer membrane subunit n=1 Tax=unclassified Sphingomonas TaxID=196159 RepID=UPI002857C343|nr:MULTISPECIES: efflux transporter outer membrane subunit [unclassified Sphingomonas]MDR6113458.1 multidrug efflux system outer membrane protein [Sphingomonas sp. SORGH_AS_0789]MDR6149181.1 multidrug efflux system outer membrane protein [Sphingomonas sp. SORGH_AS_0742]